MRKGSCWQDLVTDWMLGMRQRAWGNVDILLQDEGFQEAQKIQR